MDFLKIKWGGYIDVAKKGNRTSLFVREVAGASVPVEVNGWTCKGGFPVSTVFVGPRDQTKAARLGGK